MTGSSSSVSVLLGWSHVITSMEGLVGEGLKSRLGRDCGTSVGAWRIQVKLLSHRQHCLVVKYYHVVHLYTLYYAHYH